MSIEKVTVVKYDVKFEVTQDNPAIEHPLTIQLDGKQFATMIWTKFMAIVYKIIFPYQIKWLCLSGGSHLRSC